MKQVRLAVSLVLLLLGASSIARADSNATVTGTVTDPSGRRVPDVAVTFTNLATNVISAAATNGAGVFQLTGLLPGRYRVTIQADGFKRVERTDVDLHVQDVVVLNEQLQLGAVSEQVTVQAESAPLSTSSPAVGMVVDRDFVANLPLNGRSFQSLISLTPGVVITATSGASQGQFSINGQRPDANYFMVDGVSANVGMSPSGAANSQGNGSGVQINSMGGYNNLVSMDAMQEFKIETSTFAAEYGRLPGGQISIATRSGSNAFRGSAFEYFRDTSMNANNWFNNRSGAPRPPDEQDDFGGVLGGPIVRDRMFFFASYEGLRLKVPQTVTANVPSLAARQNASAAIRPILDAYPLPNQPQCTSGANCDPNVATFIGAYANESVMDATSVRIDWNPTRQTMIFGRINHAPSHGSIRSTSPSVVSDIILNLDTTTVAHTAVLGTHMTNDVRFNYTATPSESLSRLDAFGGAVPLPDSAMFVAPYSRDNSTYGFAGRTIGGLSAGATARDRSSQFNVIDTLSWLRGSHQIKLGFDYRRLHPQADRATFGQSIQATLTTASWVTGTINTYALSAFPPKDFSYQNVSFFAQDSWQANPRLTLHYGLRWDINPAPGSPIDGPLPAFTQVDLANLAATAVAPSGTPIYDTQWNALAPRVGAAFRLTPSRVIRGGFGVFYDTAGGATGLSERPFSSQIIANPGVMPLSPALAVRPTIATAPPWGFITTANPHLRLPYTYQSNVSLEQQLGDRQAVTVTYANAFGRNLLRRDTYPAPNPDLPQGFYAIGNESYSDYHSLQLLYQRRLSRGLQSTAAYTWARSMDTASTQAGAGTIAPHVGIEPVSDYYGPSDFDIRHSFQTAVMYSIPTPKGPQVVRAILGDWGVDGIFRVRSAPPIDLIQSNAYYAGAQPFLPGTTTTNPGGSKFATRPSMVPAASAWIDDPSAPGGRRLNPAAFIVLPANSVVATQGSLGRNALRGFGWNQLDITLRRDVPLAAATRAQVRVDVFNAFNTPAFGLNTTGVNDITNPLFGVSAATLNNSLGSGGAQGGYSPLYQIGGPRTIQLSLKVTF